MQPCPYKCISGVPQRLTNGLLSPNRLATHLFLVPTSCSAALLQWALQSSKPEILYFNLQLNIINQSKEVSPGWWGNLGCELKEKKKKKGCEIKTKTNLLTHTKCLLYIRPQKWDQILYFHNRTLHSKSNSNRGSYSHKKGLINLHFFHAIIFVWYSFSQQLHLLFSSINPSWAQGEWSFPLWKHGIIKVGKMAKTIQSEHWW